MYRHTASRQRDMQAGTQAGVMDSSGLLRVQYGDISCWKAQPIRHGTVLYEYCYSCDRAPPLERGHHLFSDTISYFFGYMISDIRGHSFSDMHFSDIQFSDMIYSFFGYVKHSFFRYPFSRIPTPHPPIMEVFSFERRAEPVWRQATGNPGSIQTGGDPESAPVLIKLLQAEMCLSYDSSPVYEAERLIRAVGTFSAYRT